jgi:hypothetical protein
VSFLDSGAGCGSPLWRCGKMRKPYHLEEGEVVTRFP